MNMHPRIDNSIFKWNFHTNSNTLLFWR